MVTLTVDFKLLIHKIIYLIIIMLIVSMLHIFVLVFNKFDYLVLISMFVFLIPLTINLVENLKTLKFILSINDYEEIDCYFNGYDYALKNFYRQRYFKKLYSLNAKCEDDNRVLKTNYIYTNNKISFKDLNKYINKEGKLLYSKSKEIILVLTNKKQNN